MKQQSLSSLFGATLSLVVTVAPVAADITSRPDTIFTTGTPHCVEKTTELLTDDLILKVTEILSNEFSTSDGLDLIKGGKNMTISDCGSFHTIVLVPPPTKDGSMWVMIDGFTTIFFFKHQLLPPFDGRYEVVIY